MGFYIDITKLSENHLEYVSELFIRNYMKARENQIILPVKYMDKKNVFHYCMIYKKSP